MGDLAGSGEAARAAGQDRVRTSDPRSQWRDAYQGRLSDSTRAAISSRLRPGGAPRALVLHAASAHHRLVSPAPRDVPCIASMQHAPSRCRARRTAHEPALQRQRLCTTQTSKPLHGLARHHRSAHRQAPSGTHRRLPQRPIAQHLRRCVHRRQSAPAPRGANGERTVLCRHRSESARTSVRLPAGSSPRRFYARGLERAAGLRQSGPSRVVPWRRTYELVRGRPIPAALLNRPPDVKRGEAKCRCAAREWRFPLAAASPRAGRRYGGACWLRQR